MQPQKKVQPYAVQVMGAKVRKRSLMLQIEVASVSFQLHFSLQNNLQVSGQFNPLLFFLTNMVHHLF